MLVTPAFTLAKPPASTESGTEITSDGFARGDSRVHGTWRKHGADFSRYSKIMVVPVQMSFRHRTEYPLTAKQRHKLRETVERSFTRELGRHFELTHAPGPDVLVLRGTISDIESFVPPEPTIGRSAVFLRRLGHATLMAEVYDSTSGEPLARIIDQRDVEHAFVRKSDPVFNRGAVEDATRDWARLISRRLRDVQRG